MRLLLFVVSFGLSLPAARGQWIHFLDRSEARLLLAAEGDSKEKDCAVGDFDRDAVTLSLRGEAGVRYRIERSEDLVNWEGIGEFLGQPGPVPFVDAGVQGRPSAFFRALSLP